MQGSLAILQQGLQRQSHTCADSSSVQSDPSVLSALSAVVPGSVGFCSAEGRSCGPAAASREEQQRELLVKEWRRTGQHLKERTLWVQLPVENNDKKTLK